MARFAIVATALVLMVPLVSSAKALPEQQTIQETAEKLLTQVESTVRCAKLDQYGESEIEWAGGASGQGRAAFSNEAGIPSLLAYSGSGGHSAMVMGCHGKDRSNYVDGYLPGWGDWSWAGTNLLGQSASMKISAAGTGKDPMLCTNAVACEREMEAAKQRALNLDGEWQASATHAGIGVSSSRGTATLNTAAQMVFGTVWDYDYQWSYEGSSSTPCNLHYCDLLRVGVHGTGFSTECDPLDIQVNCLLS